MAKVFSSGWGSMIGFIFGMAAAAAVVYFTHTLNGGSIDWGLDVKMHAAAAALIIGSAFLFSFIGGKVKKD